MDSCAVTLTGASGPLQESRMELSVRMGMFFRQAGSESLSAGSGRAGGHNR